MFTHGFQLPLLASTNIARRPHYQINQYIKYPQLRVISEDKGQVGILDKDKALALAQQEGKDLVVVSDKTEPPIAKIIDFSKFKYQQNKKQKSGQQKSKGADTKEVRFTPFMAENDFRTRIERAREFIKDGHRVKIVVKFIGRQITRKDFGIKQMEKAISSLSDCSTVDQEPKWQGKLFYAQLRPSNNEKK